MSPGARPRDVLAWVATSISLPLGVDLPCHVLSGLAIELMDRQCSTNSSFDLLPCHLSGIAPVLGIANDKERTLLKLPLGIFDVVYTCHVFVEHQDHRFRAKLVNQPNLSLAQPTAKHCNCVRNP